MSLRLRLETRELLAPVLGILARHHVLVEELEAERVASHVVRARDEVYLYFADVLRWSQPAIGALFARDHSGVCEALQRARAARAASATCVGGVATNVITLPSGREDGSHGTNG